MHESKSKGFTLAEVLITLLIIGVIASLVIPALINNTNEGEFNTGVKKAFADLSSATKMIQANNGGIINVGNGNTLTDHNAFRADFCNVMTCIQSDTATNIFGPTDYKYYKGGSANWPGGSNSAASAVLNNGTFLSFFAYINCNQYGVNACGGIIVDINGKKGPNMNGKDLYWFYVVRSSGGIYSVLPIGTQGDSVFGLPNGCTAGSSSSTTSYGCTAQRLMDPDHMP